MLKNVSRLKEVLLDFVFRLALAENEAKIRLKKLRKKMLRNFVLGLVWEFRIEKKRRESLSYERREEIVMLFGSFEN